MKDKALLYQLIWIPMMLALPFFLLLWKAAPLMHHPVWLTALSLSVVTGASIVYFSLKELSSRQEKVEREGLRQKEEKKRMQGAFNEAGTVYREKIERLEDAIHLAEETAQTLQKQVSIAQEEGKGQKNHTQAFQLSLEDSLDQLRAARAELYFQQEVGKTLPKNLPAQYRQLRTQFEEKSLILDQTRRKLFQIEGQLIASKKEELMEKKEEERLIQLIQETLEENRYLEEEIGLLEKLVAVKPKREKKEDKKPEPALELQF